MFPIHRQLAQYNVYSARRVLFQWRDPIRICPRTRVHVSVVSFHRKAHSRAREARHPHRSFPRDLLLPEIVSSVAMHFSTIYSRPLPRQFVVSISLSFRNPFVYNARRCRLFVVLVFFSIGRPSLEYPVAFQSTRNTRRTFVRRFFKTVRIFEW